MTLKLLDSTYKSSALKVTINDACLVQREKKSGRCVSKKSEICRNRILWKKQNIFHLQTKPEFVDYSVATPVIGVIIVISFHCFVKRTKVRIRNYPKKKILKPSPLYPYPFISKIWKNVLSQNDGARNQIRYEILYNTI